MSGGSFDYLYGYDYRNDDLPAGNNEELFRMVATVREQLSGHPVVDEMDALVRSLTEMHAAIEEAKRLPQMRWDRLREFMRAVEWRCSGDYGPEQVLAAADAAIASKT